MICLASSKKGFTQAITIRSQNSVLARLINVLQSASIEIFPATDVEWKNDDDYVFLRWHCRKQRALMANASYVEFSMGSLDNSFQHNAYRWF